MGKRVQVQKPTSGSSSEHGRVQIADEVVEEVAQSRLVSAVEKGEAIRGALDDVIDEIDEALVENAEEFVKNYVQRGGE